MTDRPNWRAMAMLRRHDNAGADLLLAMLRQQLRREIAEESPPRPAGDTPGAGKRMWTALNSPLALLLLSSVVLTGISQHFARTQAEASARADRRASFFKLFTELEYRLARLQVDEDQLAELAPDDAVGERRIGAHARAIIDGIASDGQSQPEYARVYTGAIVNQVELTAGLPNNRELAPVLEELTIDDCETAIALHGEMNVLRRWIALREPLVDSGKLPKLPAQVLPPADQRSLIMPDFDPLRVEDGARWRSVHDKLEHLRGRCEDVPAATATAAA